MAEKADNRKETKKVAEGFYKANTVEIDVNGVKKRVFKDEAELIKKKISKKK